MPRFEKAAKPEAPGKAAGGKSGGVPNKSVLRFASKAVLAPADMLALERVVGNQALLGLMDKGASASAPPPEIKVPILEGVNDGSVDPWTGSFKVPVDDASSPADPAAAPPGHYDEVPAGPPPSTSPDASAGPDAMSGFYSKYSVSPDLPPASASGEPAPAGPEATGGFYSKYSVSPDPPADTPPPPPGGTPDAPSHYAAYTPFAGDPPADTPLPPPGGMRFDSAYSPSPDLPLASGPAPVPGGTPDAPSHYAAYTPFAGNAPVTAGPTASAPPTATSSAPTRAPMQVPAPAKYGRTKARGSSYRTEFVEGSHELASIEAAITAKKWDLTKVMMFGFGWKQEDCDKYLTRGPAIPGAEGEYNPWSFKTGASDKPLVAKPNTEEDRHAFELVGGSPLTQGDSKDPYDTAEMFSKFSGKGWAIYVMDNGGRLFAGQHKVGLFHHSSLLGGGDAAGAGEMKVEGGRLKGITNKSGHYLPEAEQMIQVFAELESRGVSLSGVDYRHMVKPPKAKAGEPAPAGPKTVGDALAAKIDPVDAKLFYEQHKADPAAAPH